MDTIDRIQNYGTDPQVLAEITLDAPKYIPADARHISRLLKAGGLKRAERIPGGPNYTFGYNVSGNDLTLYRVNDYNQEEADILLTQATEILRNRGFLVIGQGGRSRSVFKLATTQDDEAIFWMNLHRVHVAHGNTLVIASNVPAFAEEKKAIARRARETSLRLTQEAQARTAFRDHLLEGLRAAGLKVEPAGSEGLNMNAEALAVWLGAQGVVVLP